MATQFARIHAYKATDAEGVLDEASRVEGAHPHVSAPKPPIWTMGSAEAVKADLRRHMASPEKLKMKDGKIVDRKRRKDTRAFSAGVLSWPDSLQFLRKNRGRHEAMKQWFGDSLAWLQKTYGDKLSAVVVHQDESHPHMHFFVVGECQKLHPGLAAELKNGKRIADRGERAEAYSAGLKGWLDDYQHQVGQHVGLDRGVQLAKPAWRVKDRQIRAKVVEIDRHLAVQPDQDLADLRDDLYDSSELTPRASMKF